MPLYQYKAIDAQGRRRKGLIEAAGMSDAKKKLRDQGVMVSEIAPEGRRASAKLSGDTLVNFTTQLSQLVDAGVPLFESLLALEEQYRKESCHTVILSITDQIKAGTPLSQAMAAFPTSFDKLYCGMVSAGESAGALPLVLQRLGQFLSKRQKLGKQIATAMIYPGILAGFSLLVILLLLTFVIPSIEGIFNERQLNGFTSAVLAVSHSFRQWWWVYLPAVVSLMALIVYWQRQPSGRVWRETTFIRFPLIGTLMRQAAAARFCRTMATLLSGGVTMVESLHISRSVMGNVVMEEEIGRAESKIIEGSSLSRELSHSKLMPPLVARMLAVGEESGTVTTMFSRLADIYEEEVEKTISRLLALAQPVILLVMGGIIFLVLMAMLLPMAEFATLGQ